MTPSIDPVLEQLARRIAPGSRLLRAWPLRGGISAEMVAFEIGRPDGQAQRLILRRPSGQALAANPRAARDEFLTLQLTHALGLATPAPLLLDESGARLPTPYLVIAYIEGAPAFAPDVIADLPQQLAAHLAQIHRADYSGRDVAHLARPVRGFAATFGPPPRAPNLDLAEGRIRAALAAAWPPPPRNPPALLHGDFWPGNILWHGQRAVAVIDWEDARLGDPLSDLAISRLDILWIYGAAAMDAFTTRYRSLNPIDDRDLPAWDLAAALRFIRLAGADLAAWAAFFPPFGRPDITEHTIRAHYRAFIEAALAQLPTSARSQ